MDKNGVKILIFFEELINSKRQLKGKLGHVVQIHVYSTFTARLRFTFTAYGKRQTAVENFSEWKISS